MLGDQYKSATLPPARRRHRRRPRAPCV